MADKSAGLRAADGRQVLTQRLRARRRALGMTQQQVAARLGRLGLPTTNRTLSSLERGAGLDGSKLPDLAAALDCSVTYLLGLTDDPRRWQPDARHPRSDARPQPVADPPDRRRPPILGPEVPERPTLAAPGA